MMIIKAGLCCRMSREATQRHARPANKMRAVLEYEAFNKAKSWKQYNVKEKDRKKLGGDGKGDGVDHLEE